MSRYVWPVSDRRRDRALQRMAHVARMRGAAAPADLAQALRVRRTVSTTADELAGVAPTGDVNLWLPVGPSTVLQGQAGGRPRVAGRVRDLAVSPDGQRVYAATANGGVWYSENAGTTWEPVGAWSASTDPEDREKPANVLVSGCLLVAFGAGAAADRVLVGTGEITPRAGGTPGGKLGGVGVLFATGPVATVRATPTANPWSVEATNLAGEGIYRLAHDPANFDRVVAATSAGLYFRTGTPAAGAEWQRVTEDPFDFEPDDPDTVTDVAWTPASGETPSRLWVALRDPDAVFTSDTNVWVSDNGASGPFVEVDLDGRLWEGRLGIATSPSQPTTLYVLGKGPKLWRIDGTTAHPVANVPRTLFGKDDDSDQSSYDLAVAVHPTDPNRVVIGGSTQHVDGSHNASLFRCDVTGSAEAGFSLSFSNQADPPHDGTFIGHGVHADVHAIRFVAVSSTRVDLWIGCDGGAFHSMEAGDPHTFRARNDDLAVLECGYVASHPTHDGLLVAGTQDNGTLERVGDTIWKAAFLGDGGGVVFDPADPTRYFRQYIRSSWESQPRGSAPPVKRGVDKDSEEEDEDDLSSFYSGGAAIESEAGGSRLAIGTTRIWLSEDWGQTWVTIPSAIDPRDGDDPDADLDVPFDADDSAVITCRWATPTRLLVLCRRAVIAYEESGDEETEWEEHVLSRKTVKCGSFGNDDIPEDEAETLEFLPPLSAWSDLSVHDPARGTYGSFYVAVTGHHAADRMDTLWWFDGTGAWHRTRLRSSSTGSKAPAYAVVSDPEDTNVVYVGTAVGVWKGEITWNGETPSWTWSSFNNGLPEATVQDLSLFTNGVAPLLRAALQARGVWEVDLRAMPSPPTRTYLRVHDDDTRRDQPTGLSSPRGSSPHSWHASPDIRIRPAPQSGLPPPAGLPLTGSADRNFDLWAFQTALHAIDPLCRPTGGWSSAFAARLRVHHPGSLARIDAALWNSVGAVADFFSTPWDGGEPTEADLYELIVERPGISRVPTISHVEQAAYRVDVLVHHRHVLQVAPGQVRVALLRRPLAVPQDQWSGLAIDDEWKTRVTELLSGSPPGGWAPPSPWELADPAGTRQPAGPIDARTPRAVTFEVDLSASPSLTNWLLLAVVGTAGDPVTEASFFGGTLEVLVVSSHHVAARVLRVT